MAHEAGFTASLRKIWVSLENEPIDLSEHYKAQKKPHNVDIPDLGPTSLAIHWLFV